MQNIEGNYQMCSRCVMDTSAADIVFDSAGVCNYCMEFMERSSHIIDKSEVEREAERHVFIAKVKRDGLGKKYDCIVGVSGGVDSSYALYMAVQEGLRPLAVHMDNGWDSELAQENIQNLVQKLGVDLYTHVINWDEYRRLQQSFFDANVIDIELLYDNAMLAVNFQQATKYQVKYLLSGSNQSTEGMQMPKNWNWYKYDKKNIFSIWKQFGDGSKVKSFPSISTLDYCFYIFGRKICWVSFLDFYDYKKEEALNLLETEIAYRRYPYKHYESIFTRFYQGYILPQKFGSY